MSVYKSICAVQAELAKTGISKDSTNTFDNYQFRGIDAVYNALSPLLAKHGLCILPRILSRASEERVSKKGDPVFYVTVEAEFDFVCAEDGSKHTIKTFGEAMDRGDKATNKAMSAAYKYAAFQAFAIPTEGDNDADATTHDIKGREPHPASGAGTKKEAYDSLKPHYREWIDKLAEHVNAEPDYEESHAYIEDKIASAERIASDPQNKYYDPEFDPAIYKMGLWWKLDSKVRTAIDSVQKGLRKAA